MGHFQSVGGNHALVEADTVFGCPFCRCAVFRLYQTGVFYGKRQSRAIGGNRVIHHGGSGIPQGSDNFAAAAGGRAHTHIHIHIVAGGYDAFNIQSRLPKDVVININGLVTATDRVSDGARFAFLVGV